jgi:hypothetical protein
MSKKTLKFNIRQDGTVFEEVLGIKGTDCLDITEEIEKKLGNIQWRKETLDYYQQENIEKNVTLQHNQHQN